LGKPHEEPNSDNFNHFALRHHSLGIFISLIILLTINTYDTFSQISEIGFGIGGLTYTGDLQRGYNIANNRPALTAFFRSNLSDVVSLKIGLTGGILKDSDDNPIDQQAALRNESFDILLAEVATTIEYHFLDFRSEHTYLRWSPYFFTGIGIFTFSGEGEKNAQFSNVQLAIPIGVGFKYNLNPKYQLGLEWGIRKTFFDYLDNISGGDILKKSTPFGNESDDDLYYFLGLSITYSFYKIPCPYPSY